MRQAGSTSAAPGVTRARVDRFAATLADERARQEERDALRAAMLSTCQRDRSAVQAVADVFRLDPSVVYRWADGEIKHHPLRAFCELLDACIAAKGQHNPAALEPARLIRRRYLEAEPDEQLTAVAHERQPEGYEIRRQRADRHAAYVQGAREESGLPTTPAEWALIADAYMAGEEEASQDAPRSPAAPDDPLHAATGDSRR